VFAVIARPLAPLARRRLPTTQSRPPRRLASACTPSPRKPMPKEISPSRTPPHRHLGPPAVSAPRRAGRRRQFIPSSHAGPSPSPVRTTVAQAKGPHSLQRRRLDGVHYRQGCLHDDRLLPSISGSTSMLVSTARAPNSSSSRPTPSSPASPFGHRGSPPDEVVLP
jgi:hypothetical protein